MLKVPTDAPRELMYLFDYQLTVLNSIRIDDEQLEHENNQVIVHMNTSCLPLTSFPQNVEAVEWLRPSNPEKAADLICVYMGPKYIVPSSSTTSGTKRRARTVKQPRIMVAAPAPANNAPAEPVPLITPTGMSFDIQTTSI